MVVVGGGNETVAGGGGGDEAGDDGGRETKSIVCLRRTYEFPANAAHALSQNTTVSLRKFIS